MKMLLHLLALACLALALAGCFRSKTLLLDLTQAAHPFPDGIWIGDDDETTRVSMSTRGPAYLMVEGNSRNDVVLAPIAGRANAYAAAQSDEGCAERADSCEWEYGVVIIEGEELRFLSPNCESDWAAVSTDVSSRDEDGDICWFERADGLQSALAKVVDRGGKAIVYSRE
jgi:hypothetical protein